MINCVLCDLPVHQVDKFAVWILVGDFVDLFQQSDQNKSELQVEAFDAFGKRFIWCERRFTLNTAIVKRK